MPRTQIAIFAAVLAAAAGLAALASRSLESQRLVLEQAAVEEERRDAALAAAAWRESLDGAAARFLAAIPEAPGIGGLAAALGALEDRPAVAAAFAFDRAGRLAWPPAPAAARGFVEELPADVEGRVRLREAWRMEFRGGDEGQALTAYAAIAGGAYGQTLRVEARLQEAALAARLDQPGEAVAAYTDALAMWRFTDPENVLRARMERARLFRGTGEEERAEEDLLRLAEELWGPEAGRFGSALDAGRTRVETALAAWPLSVAGRNRRDLIASRADKARARAAARDRAAGAVPALVRSEEPPAFAALGAGLLAAWKTGRSGITAGVILKVEAMDLAGPGALLANGVALRGTPAAGGASAPVPGAAGLSAAIPPSGSAASAIRRQRLLFLAGLAVLLAALAAGLFLSFRAVRREAELAKLKSDFVANVSHEIKTPLALVRMYAETLALGRVSDAAEKKEYMEVILRESERLSTMIERILDFARIERGERAYERRPGDLAAAARAAAEAFARQAGTPVRVDAPAPVRAAFDPEGVALAVRNLLENAVKYSDGSPDVALSVFERNGAALIAVDDRGIGVPAADRARVFDRFYRSPDPRARRVKGTGLGLALVAHVMAGHNGDARCEPRPDGGSRFILSFPRSPDAPDHPGR